MGAPCQRQTIIDFKEIFNMKARLSRSVALFISIVVFLSSFAANPLSKSVTFLEARYVPGTGIVLLFETTGLKKSDLRGATINVHSNQYDLSCSFKDAGKNDETKIVRCVASGGLTEYAGESFTAFLAGYGFSGIVPAEKIGEASSSCPEGEELWLLITIFDNEDEFTITVPAELFYSFILPLIQEEDLGYQIIDQACFPIEEEQSSEPG